MGYIIDQSRQIKLGKSRSWLLKSAIPTPLIFLWQTAEDEAVPVENSIYFFQALYAHCISLKMHIYPHGCHGLGLANELTRSPEGGRIQKECQKWITVAKAWIENL